MLSSSKKILWLTIFSIAMGFMETAIVVYLRKIYYPDGFAFPLAPIDPHIGIVEVLREAATIIMLVGIGILTGKTASQKFAFFIYSFAIWDLFYYIFLWLLIGWPESLFTWDILFLIPVPWVGPVLSACIVAVTMIVLAYCLNKFQDVKHNAKITFKEWVLFISGSLTLIVSFVWDYFKYATGKNIDNDSGVYEENIFNDFTNYIPSQFNWPVFLGGEAIILVGIIVYFLRMSKSLVNTKKELVNENTG